MFTSQVMKLMITG